MSNYNTNLGYIYVIENDVNDKIYVGKKHSAVFVPSYYGSGAALSKAIRKYGINNFKVELIEFHSCLETLNKAEIYWIKKLNSHKSSNKGYNISWGGDGSLPGKLSYNYGRKHSEQSKKLMSVNREGVSPTSEQRKQISETLKFYYKNNPNPFLGKKHSKESLAKMSKALKGKAPWQKGMTSEEDNRILSGSKHPMFGRTHSEESRGKISQNHADVSGGNNCNAVGVLITVVSTQEKIECETLNEASEIVGKHWKTISRHTANDKVYQIDDYLVKRV